MTSTRFQYPCTGSQLADRRTRGWTDVHSTQVSLLVFGVLLCLGLNGFAQATDSRMTEEAKTSWTAVTESKRDNAVPVRIVESYSQEGNRTLDKRSAQRRGYAGHFEFYQDTETETLQLDANTVRVTTRIFGQDGNRSKTLLTLSEELKHTLPNGDSNTVRITSRSDLNGLLQVVQREIVETKVIGEDTEEANTTVLLPSINGGFEPAVKIHKLRKRAESDTVHSEETLLRDGAGNWQVRELRENTSKQQDHNLSTEERIFRRDAEDKLVEVSRVVGEESETTPGEKRDVVETYSLQIPGTSPNGSLQLMERATTTQHTTALGEQVTVQRVEQRNLDNPNSGLRVSILVTDTVRPDSAGTQATRTIWMRDVNAGFEVVEVDTTKSDKVLTLHLPKPMEYPK